MSVGVLTCAYTRKWGILWPRVCRPLNTTERRSMTQLPCPMFLSTPRSPPALHSLFLFVARKDPVRLYDRDAKLERFLVLYCRSSPSVRSVGRTCAHEMGSIDLDPIAPARLHATQHLFSSLQHSRIGNMSEADAYTRGICDGMCACTDDVAREGARGRLEDEVESIFCVDVETAQFCARVVQRVRDGSQSDAVPVDV